MTHICDIDLERITSKWTDDELVALEEHNLGYPKCAARVQEAAEYGHLHQCAVGTSDMEFRPPLRISEVWTTEPYFAISVV